MSNQETRVLREEEQKQEIIKVEPTEIRKEYNGEGIADPTEMSKRPREKTQ